MNFALIVAGGTGTRMHSEIPKQFLELDRVPILMRTLHAFHRADPLLHLVLVLPDDQQEYWISLCHRFQFHVPHPIITGGSSRFQSVKNGLAYIFDLPGYDAQTSLISIHDGVRPCIQPEKIREMLAIAQVKKAVVPGLTPIDSMRIMDTDAGTSTAIDRQSLKQIQTPQIFLGTYLESAYQQQESPAFTDDASVVEKIGIPIYVTEGDPSNIKITRPIDLSIAMTLLKNRLEP